MENPLNLINENRFAQENERTYSDGELIFAEGEEGRELYIIQEGTVEIIKETKIGPVVLARFGKGHFFGDMALLQSIPRNASAYAKGKVSLLVLQPGGFLLKIRRDPTLAFEMLQQLSARVRVANERLMEFLQTSGMSAEEINSILSRYDGLQK